MRVNGKLDLGNHSVIFDKTSLNNLLGNQEAVSVTIDGKQNPFTGSASASLYGVGEKKSFAKEVFGSYKFSGKKSVRGYGIYFGVRGND